MGTGFKKDGKFRPTRNSNNGISSNEFVNNKNGYDFNFDDKNLRLASRALYDKWSLPNGKLNYKKANRYGDIVVTEDRIHYSQPKGKYENIDCWVVEAILPPTMNRGSKATQLGFFKSEAEAKKFVMGGKHRFNNLTTEQKKRYKELYG